MNFLLISTALVLNISLVLSRPAQTGDDLAEQEEDQDPIIGNLLRTDTTNTEEYAKEEKKLFEDFLSHESKEERLQNIRKLRERNAEEQRKRREERKRRRRRRNKGKKTKVTRVNRNTRRFNCGTGSPAHVVRLMLLIHSQKMRDQMASQWLRECGGDSRARRNVRTTAVRYFG